MTENIQFDEQILADEVARVSAIFAEVLKLPHVGQADNFFNLGGDSFDAIRVMSRLSCNLPIVTLFEHPTATDLARRILSEATRQAARLVCFGDAQAAAGATAVVAVPFGGGDATAYRNLFQGQQEVQVFGVDFGDFEVEDASDFHALLDTLATQIEGIGAKRLVIYGHCAGAATAACLASSMADSHKGLSLVVAASRPVLDADAAIRAAEVTSDQTWTDYLRSLGAFTGLLDTQVESMLARGRRDHLVACEAYRYLAQYPARDVPALVLLGDQDPATAEPETVLEHWSQFIDVTQAATLAGGGHYFVRTHAHEVEETVLAFAAHNTNGRDSKQ
ncbi:MULTISPECIES: alpha/beta fold hydrolase [Pseudomonas]|uniref:Alpha/beta fold hydrolase n=1 Tax=Pseudomonas sessilinigenes TaxID=658629 RepID=A0ABX8MQ88_9PSED|nr:MULTISPECIES: alpha/beta fold hydrolase [Pseudomonas]AZC26664.1 Peptide synthetase [Pseudomonas sessilinigenes]QIH08016.1 alpha/beta fold hydrolase [Pseudomonas sp. BIOMIG1BAC]QXH39346.1 alpha/beta fold hydrolase [Pseudomonas sessilinigenes]UMZ09104.1 alpha/beta fold hydrolase [Pseudomonas sp. MPFS]